MGYTVRTDIEAEFSTARLAQLLGAQGDGPETPGLYDSLAAAVDSEIDGKLSANFAVPITGDAPALRYIARVLFCDLLSTRSLIPAGMNPYKDRAQAARERLDAIANGTLPLAAANAQAGAFTAPQGFHQHDRGDPIDGRYYGCYTNFPNNP